MANLRDSAVDEIESVDRLVLPGVGEPTGIEPEERDRPAVFGSTPDN